MNRILPAFFIPHPIEGIWNVEIHAAHLNTRKTLTAFLVLISSPVLLAAEFAVGRRQRVVHPVVYWFDGLQVCKDRLQVLVRHAPVYREGHEWAQLPSAHSA